MNPDDVVDELYGLLPSEFTAARDARASEARKAGDRERAEALKQLRRPTAGAFLANVLVRERREDLDTLLELGTAMRQAQAEGEGGQLRRLSQERRQSIARLAKEAGRLAGERGQEAGAGAVRELEDTLEAAVADTEAAAALRSGRLTTALRFSGFGSVDLTAAVAVAPTSAPTAASPKAPARAARAAKGPAAKTPPPKAPPPKTPTRPRAAAPSERRRRQLEAAEEAVRRAEDVLREAADAADELAGKFADARQRVESRRAERQELEARLRQLRQDEEVADRELREAKTAAEGADRARRTARAGLDRAEAARRRLEA